MIIMGQFDRSSLLKKHGISILTGEACGVLARVLCDVNERGKALLTEVLGLASLVPADAWNFREGTVGSVSSSPVSPTVVQPPIRPQGERYETAM